MRPNLILWLSATAVLSFVKLDSVENESACACCSTAKLDLCPSDRKTVRSDCPCCPVCARQSGETCDQISLPCDTQFRLNCENGICQGPSNLRAVNATNNATKIEWDRGVWSSVVYGTDLNGTRQRKDIPSNENSLIVDGLLPNSTYYFNLESLTRQLESEIIVVVTKDACDVNGTWLAEGESITEGCEKRCTCGAGGKVDCNPRCFHRPGSISDPLCIETRDEKDECCVEYACAQTKDSGASPHLIVTGRAPSNVSMAWDDFKPPSYERGYVLEVRVAGSEGNRIRLQANNTNMMTIENLTPNTRYEVRVAIWDEHNKLTSASEFINVTTTDGCVKKNRTYRVDEEWTEGCEKKCVCRQNNSIECSPRCAWPLYRADAPSTDPHCTPIPEKDTCCVSMRCEHDTVLESSAVVSRCPNISWTESDRCVSTCQSDNDCSAQNELCCPTSCGAKVCVNNTTGAENETDICVNVVCGPHSQCRLVAGAATCQCVDGAIGNPNDYTRGCTPRNSPSLHGGCAYKNQTYLPGENFFDGCEYRCLCSLNSEIECEPRCVPPAESLNDPTCHVIADPSDSCCNVTMCGSHPIKEPTKKVAVDLVDGCFYRNKTYQRLEQIQEGCSMKCTCQGRGSISCVPRCPPSAPVTAGCVVLPDPIDSCCNVTICNVTGLPDDLKETTTEKKIETTTSVLSSENTVNVPENTIVPQAITTKPTINNTIEEKTLNSTKKEPEEAVSAKENFFPVPTKDAFNELGSTDAAKKGESTSKSIRTVNNVTQPAKLEETTLETTMSTTEVAEVNHLVKELSTESDTLTSTLSTTTENVTPLNSTDNLQTESSDLTTTSDETTVELTSTDASTTEKMTTLRSLLSISHPDKKERGRKLEDKVTGLNNDVHCELNGIEMAVGQELADGCHRICRCLEGGKTSCTLIICPYSQPPQVSGCLDWRYDREFQPKPGNCCAETTCVTKVPIQTGSPCEYRGRSFSNLEPIPADLVASCDLDCRCMNGNVSCESRCLPIPPEPPSDLTCFHHNAQVTQLPHDRCCKGWQCPDMLSVNHEEEFDSLQGSFLPPIGPQTPPTSEKIIPQNPFLVAVPQEEQSDVIFKGNHDLFSPSHPLQDPSLTNVDNFPLNPMFAEKECETSDGPRLVGQQWEESPGCRSRKCVCVLLSNGSTTVECTGGCYPIERYLKPTSGCPLPVLVTPDDPCFCPFVMCNKTDSEHSIQNLTAVALNSTSVRVSLVIPKLYVGLYGQVELLYTDDATQTNTSTWNKEVFSHRNDMFAEPQMQHDLGDLLPDTTYYVKAEVILTGNSNTATSSVVTVRTPPLFISTTAATTLPSKIAIDPSFNTTDIQATSIRLSWRQLTDQEKKIVDGIQLKYRVQGDEKWSLTTFIHRDVTSYVLRDLQPNTAYEVDMALNPIEGIPTEIETLNSVTFQTKRIHDDYAFEIILVVDKVFISSANLHWSGVPFPMHKYVHLYIIKYKMDSQVETQTIYKYPKVEQVSLEGLKPGNRYQVWMEAILSNGDVRKSNMIEFVTKAGVALKQPEKERLETSQSVSRATAEATTNNSYYEALIAVAVVAAICVLGFVALLVLLFRRHASTSSNTPSSSAHKSQSAYENPTYKPSYEGELENGKTQA